VVNKYLEKKRGEEKAKKKAETEKRKKEKDEAEKKRLGPVVCKLLHGERPLVLFPTPPLDYCVLFWSVRCSAEGHL